MNISGLIYSYYCFFFSFVPKVAWNNEGILGNKIHLKSLYPTFWFWENFTEKTIFFYVIFRPNIFIKCKLILLKNLLSWGFYYYFFSLLRKVVHYLAEYLHSIFGQLSFGCIPTGYFNLSSNSIFVSIPL